ncbi:MAG: transposase [Sphingopyxis sp.]|nr:transposase [Sphingopyxis sp.]
MARLPRIVIPSVPHHVTQRGNRRLPVFFSDDDRAEYLALVRDGCARHGVTCVAWCLMDNHVHLILVPGENSSDTIPSRRIFQQCPHIALSYMPSICLYRLDAPPSQSRAASQVRQKIQRI